MVTTECRECGKRVSSTTAACPDCQYIWVKPERKPRMIVTGIVILVVVVTVVLVALL